MIIGHLPVGYLLSTALSKKWCVDESLHRLFLTAGMIGAIFPDIDMFYFYLVDNRQHHHHSYFTHWPIVWVLLMLMACFIIKSSRYKTCGLLAIIFSINGFTHMLLDSLVADIQWGAPFSLHTFALFYVPEKYSSVWFNFIFHWSFLFELAAVIMAITVYQKRKVKKRSIEKRREAFYIAA